MSTGNDVNHHLGETHDTMGNHRNVDCKTETGEIIAILSDSEEEVSSVEGRDYDVVSSAENCEMIVPDEVDLQPDFGNNANQRSQSYETKEIRKKQIKSHSLVSGTLVYSCDSEREDSVDQAASTDLSGSQSRYGKRKQQLRPINSASCTFVSTKNTGNIIQEEVISIDDSPPTTPSPVHSVPTHISPSVRKPAPKRQSRPSRSPVKKDNDSGSDWESEYFHGKKKKRKKPSQCSKSVKKVATAQPNSTPAVSASADASSGVHADFLRWASDRLKAHAARHIDSNAGPSAQSIQSKGSFEIGMHSSVNKDKNMIDVDAGKHKETDQKHHNRSSQYKEGTQNDSPSGTTKSNVPKRLENLTLRDLLNRSSSEATAFSTNSNYRILSLNTLLSDSFSIESPNNSSNPSAVTLTSNPDKSTPTQYAPTTNSTVHVQNDYRSRTNSFLLGSSSHTARPNALTSVPDQSKPGQYTSATNFTVNVEDNYPTRNNSSSVGPSISRPNLLEAISTKSMSAQNSIGKNITAHEGSCHPSAISSSMGSKTSSIKSLIDISDKSSISATNINLHEENNYVSRNTPRNFFSAEGLSKHSSRQNAMVTISDKSKTPTQNLTANQKNGDPSRNNSSSVGSFSRSSRLDALTSILNESITPAQNATVKHLTSHQENNHPHKTNILLSNSILLSRDTRPPPSTNFTSSLGNDLFSQIPCAPSSIQYAAFINPTHGAAIVNSRQNTPNLVVQPPIHLFPNKPTSMVGPMRSSLNQPITTLVKNPVLDQSSTTTQSFTATDISEQSQKISESSTYPSKTSSGNIQKTLSLSSTEALERNTSCIVSNQIQTTILGNAPNTKTPPRVSFGSSSFVTKHSKVAVIVPNIQNVTPISNSSPDINQDKKRVENKIAPLTPCGISLKQPNCCKPTILNPDSSEVQKENDVDVRVLPKSNLSTNLSELSSPNHVLVVETIAPTTIKEDLFSKDNRIAQNLESMSSNQTSITATHNVDEVEAVTKLSTTSTVNVSQDVLEESESSNAGATSALRQETARQILRTSHNYSLEEEHKLSSLSPPSVVELRHSGSDWEDEYLNSSLGQGKSSKINHKVPSKLKNIPKQTQCDIQYKKISNEQSLSEDCWSKSSVSQPAQNTVDDSIGQSSYSNVQGIDDIAVSKQKTSELCRLNDLASNEPPISTEATDLRNTQCGDCGKILSVKSLQTHKYIHRGLKPLKCSACDEMFRYHTSRSNHYKRVHLNVQLKKPTLKQCVYCGLQTHSQEHLTRHEMVHSLPEGASISSLLEYKCSICHKEYISKFKLLTHMKAHRATKCDHCNLRFYKKSATYTRHLKEAHDVVRESKCNKCDMVFNDPRYLQNHKAYAHKSVIPSFFCDICEKGFKKKHLLEQHLITHSEDRPFACTECDESFKRKTHLKQHITAIHKDEKRS